MVTTRLEIDGTNYPIVTDIPVSVNFVQADIREPDKRNASFTKTIQLYGTNEINKLFENIFEVNTVTGYFNVNIKTPAKYYVNDILNFKGDLQLLKITNKPDNNLVYDCTIIGQEGSLFVDIGDAYLEDLDFSAYNHTYNRTNQIASWSNAGTGSGYYYGFIHRGLNGGSDTTFSVRDFIPQFFVREYLEKIFTLHGYTWTSSILDSTEFKSLVVEPNMSTVLISQTALENRQFYVGLNSNSTRTANSTWTAVNYPNESGANGFFDVGGQVSGVNAVLNDSGYYNVAAADYYKISFTHTDPSVVKANFLFQSGKRIEKSGNGGVTWFPLSLEAYVNFDNNGVNMNINTNYYWNNQVATGEAFLTSGDYIRASSYLRQINTATYYDVSNNVVSTGTGTITIELISGTGKTSFYALATKRDLFDGNTIEVNNALPKKIKQKDFVKSIMQMYNLYIDYDRNNPKALTIESYPDYFDNGIVDWENKVDYSKEINISPVSLLDAKKYTYTYKEDKDYYNTKYKDTYNEVFGAEIIDIENDFQKSEKKNEVIFSSTPNVANYGLGIAMPKIFKEDPNISIKPTVPNIRILYAGGTKQTINPYTYKEFNSADLVTTDYAYCGHVDDPQTPTIDLNFGTPKEVYYSFIGSSFTNNNLYNRFHKPFVYNNTSRDSKVVTAYLYLTPNDIYNFSFRKKYFIVINGSGAYYIVNKIINYNPLESASTQCELIKVLQAELFTPESTMIDGGLIPSGGAVTLPVPETSMRLGTNSNVLGSNCLAIGNNVNIPESCSNVIVVGDNITIAENTSNFTYVNGQISTTVNGEKASVKTITSNYNIKAFDDTILVDATSGNVTVTLTYSTVDYLISTVSLTVNGATISTDITKVITIKRIDNSGNTVTIDGDGRTIDGDATIDILSKESLTLQYDGTNWIIK